MRHDIRFFIVGLLFTLAIDGSAQNKTWREMHKVKRKETVYGIARQYDVTEEQLRKANPEMQLPDYKLKKGDYIFIPFPEVKKVEEKPKPQPTPVTTDVRTRAIRVGVMLPLHDVDGDGRRMVEYYRGILMACEELKREGISTDIRAWNVNIDADISKTLAEKNADNLDIVFGPLYTRQMDAVAQFLNTHDTKLVIPFSITGNHVLKNKNIFQVYQTPERLNEAAIEAFLGRFLNHHIVFIDCNDRTSGKGIFTFGLRKHLDAKSVAYSITNLNSSPEAFAKAFVTDKPNVVILNTGRSPELTAAFQKLDVLTVANSGVRVSLFGYNEWLMYEYAHVQKFHKYDTYVPTYYYYNTLSGKTQEFETKYRQNFGTSMMNALPRFGITGHDHALFFLRGLHKQGTDFTGETPDKNSLQTQLKFVRTGKDGGMQNQQFMLVHYNTNKSISTIIY